MGKLWNIYCEGFGKINRVITAPHFFMTCDRLISLHLRLSIPRFTRNIQACLSIYTHTHIFIYMHVCIVPYKRSLSQAVAPLNETIHDVSYKSHYLYFYCTSISKGICIGHVTQGQHRSWPDHFRIQWQPCVTQGKPVSATHVRANIILSAPSLMICISC